MPPTEAGSTVVGRYRRHHSSPFPPVAVCRFFLATYPEWVQVVGAHVAIAQFVAYHAALQLTDRPSAQGVPGILRIPSVLAASVKGVSLDCGCTVYVGFTSNDAGSGDGVDCATSGIGTCASCSVDLLPAAPTLTLATAYVTCAMSSSEIACWPSSDLVP